MSASPGRIVLIVVLALSLLGNAVAIGAAARLRQVRQDFGSETALTLPRDLRRDLLQALARDDGLKAAFARVQAARSAFVTAATARPHDTAATEASLIALRAEVAALMEAAQPLILSALSKR